MREGQSDLLKAIVIISLTFLMIAIGLILQVTLSYRRKKKHIQEKERMRYLFDAEILKVHHEVQEQTMQTIAAELHDNIGQLLSLTNLTLNSIDLGNEDKSEEKIKSSINLVNTSIKELRDLAKLLQGEQIVEIGLSFAIQQEIDRLKRSEQYQIIEQMNLEYLMERSVDKDLVILRLIQEMFNNIIKHAQAKLIEVSTYFENGAFHLRVYDDGVGFDYELAKQKKNGLGLSSLNKRVRLLNGKIQVDSNDNGTTIQIQIPYP